ncbi:MAG: hypothetical protein AUI14_16265 [Actinobacteria bacterium 13_2_20CM_2_71_6]|nr:MAG: hypothetical protein AUI14_16265 [Actinobacteria bacterium 13_2_20CM_2_71_6]
MPGSLLHVGATVTCPHGGQATPQPAQSRVSVGGQPVTTLAHQYTVAGCGFNVSGAPHPCVTIRWLTPASRVQVNGSPVLLSGSGALCLAADQLPQGPPAVVVVQQRVVGL